MWTGWRNALQRWKANHDANLERLGKRRALGWATYHHDSNLKRLEKRRVLGWATYHHRSNLERLGQASRIGVNLRGKTTNGFLSPLGIPQLSYPSPPSYFTSLRTGSYSYAASSSCEPREPDGDKAGKTGNADASASLHGKCVPWNSRSIVAVDKGSCGQGLHASALRRSYIPMRWGIARYRSRLHAPA